MKKLHHFDNYVLKSWMKFLYNFISEFIPWNHIHKSQYHPKERFRVCSAFLSEKLRSVNFSVFYHYTFIVVHWKGKQSLSFHLRTLIGFLFWESNSVIKTKRSDWLNLINYQNVNKKVNKYDKRFYDIKRVFTPKLRST